MNLAKHQSNENHKAYIPMFSPTRIQSKSEKQGLERSTKILRYSIKKNQIVSCHEISKYQLQKGFYSEHLALTFQALISQVLQLMEMSVFHSST